MTKLLDLAVAAARGLSDDAQDVIARVVLRLAGTDGAAAYVTLTEAECRAIAASQAAAARGAFATDAQMCAVWLKHGL